MFRVKYLTSRQQLADWLKLKSMESYERRQFRLAHGMFEASLRLSDEQRPRGRFDTSSQVEIGRFLEAKAGEWQRGELPTPKFCREELPPDPDGLKRLRMLVVVSEYINNSMLYLKNEMVDHLAVTASRAGIDTDIFYIDDCSYPDLLGISPNAAARLAEFRNKVLEYRPDVLFVDTGFIGNEYSINAPLLAELKAATGALVIGYVCDAWQERTVAVGAYWAPVCDALYHAMPGSPMDRELAGAVVWSGQPVNRGRFYPQGTRDISVSFIGSAPPLRAYMLAAVNSLSIPGMHLVGHERKNACPSLEEYSDVMRRSKIVLDFSGPTIERVNGRVWQSLACGCLLLAEQNAGKTDDYFVPYVHYVPFSNTRELRRLVAFFTTHEDVARRIGEAAARWCDAHYDEVRLWSDIIGKTRALSAARRSS